MPDRKMLPKQREKRDAAAIKAIDEALRKTSNEETVKTLTKAIQAKSNNASRRCLGSRRCHSSRSDAVQ